MWEGGGFVYQLTMFVGAVCLCVMVYLIFIGIVGAGMNAVVNHKIKVYSTRNREETEARVMEQAIAYEASHGNELSIEAIKAAQTRLREMTDAELMEAENEMASLSLSI